MHSILYLSPAIGEEEGAVGPGPDVVDIPTGPGPD